MKRHVRRVLRGGSYYIDSRSLRSTNRYWGVPVIRYWCFGFRIVVIRRKR